jgi:hypothetical protein
MRLMVEDVFRGSSFWNIFWISASQWTRLLSSMPRTIRLEVGGTAALELVKTIVKSLETT